MKLSVEVEREVDGRWIAEVLETPGAPWPMGQRARKLRLRPPRWPSARSPIASKPENLPAPARSVVRRRVSEVPRGLVGLFGKKGNGARVSKPSITNFSAMLGTVPPTPKEQRP